MTQLDTLGTSTTVGVEILIPAFFSFGLVRSDEGWPRECLKGIERLNADAPIALLTQSGDWMLTGNTSTKALEADTFVDVPGPLAWAICRQYGLGHVVTVGGNITHDAVVATNPDNVLWISRVLPVLSDRTAEERSWEQLDVPQPQQATVDDLHQDESQYFERKATARLDRRGELDSTRYDAVLKTIAAFLNADGGVLALGLDDSGEVLGLDADILSVGERGRDGYEQWLINKLAADLGQTIVANNVLLGWRKLPGGPVLIAACRRSGAPVLTKSDEFFVRVGNQTRKFSARETAAYVQSHFSHR